MTLLGYFSLIEDLIKALPQAIATVIAASLVLAGVIATLRQNQRRHNEELKDGKRRLRHAQLENRAKELQATLQDKYADFASIGIKVLSETVYLKHASEQLQRLKKEADDRQGELRADDPLVELHNALKNEYGERTRGTIELGLKIAAAVMGIGLRDDDTARKAALEKMYARIMTTTKDTPIAVISLIDLELRAFIESVRVGLEEKYRRDADLAEHGRYPMPHNGVATLQGYETQNPAIKSEGHTEPSKA